MQISDLVGQYHYAVSAGAEKVTGTKGVENLVSSLKSLTKGNIFEGTVSSVKNGRVTLALSNGTQLTARLDGKVTLSEGQSMFFQVKANDGSMISIRPFSVDGNGVNYTLLQALSAAGLPAESGYLSMVDKMMEEQMPIDRASLQQMARLVNANGGIDVRTLVQMSKLGIEITPENAAQFENYLGDRQAITAAIDSLIDGLPTAMQGSGLSGEALRQMNSQVLSVITEAALPETSQAGKNLLLLAAASEGVQGAGNGQSGTESVGATDTQGVENGQNVQAPPEGNSETFGSQTATEASGSGSEVNGQSMPAVNSQGAAKEQNVQETATPQSAVDGQELQAVPEGKPAGAAEPQAAAAAAEAQDTSAERPGVQVAANAVDAQNVQDAAENNRQSAPAEINGKSAPAEVDGKSAPAEVNRQSAPAEVNRKSAPAEVDRQSAPAEVNGQSAPAAQPHTLASVLDTAQRERLNGMLRELVGQKELHYDGTKDVNALLNDLRELLESRFPVRREPLSRLLSSREFKALVKDGLERQWTIRPEELTGSDKINRLYEKLDRQMDRISQVLRATGQESANFAQTAADIRSNVEFMNQINQAYAYVQIPLKMSGQTASGELYVYTNKKALMEGDKELTAFLHLDMDNLGPTDISVKLLRREVSTSFYLENDAAYNLLEKHLPILEERLKAKGYNCKVSVINETRHVNFVEDFLKKDQPSAGRLHRYSFDMRA